MTAREMFEKLGYEFKEIFSDDNSNYTYEYSCGGKRFVFQGIDKKGIATDSVKYIFLDELKAVIQQAKELGWLKDEKKAETNYVHYEDEIIDLCMCDFAVLNKKIKMCSETPCDECIFSDENGVCIGPYKIKDWFKQPYEKLTYKLSQFEYDLLRTNNMSHDRKLSSFATYEDLREIGYFNYIDFDLTINEVLANCEVIKDA